MDEAATRADPDDLALRVQALERALSTACAVIVETCPDFIGKANARLRAYEIKHGALPDNTHEGAEVFVGIKRLLHGEDALPGD